MTFTFMSDGIPIVYYGQEQYFSGAGDPVSDPVNLYIVIPAHDSKGATQNNREALWPSNYQQTNAYKLIATLNHLRNYLVSTSDWAKQETQLMTTGPEGVAIMKGPVISILTNIGSPVGTPNFSCKSLFDIGISQETTPISLSIPLILHRLPS